MESSNCKPLEEDIYWKNFHFARFSITLSNGFLQRIVLPKKFSHHMKTLLPEKVTLKVNGNIWNVNLVKDKDDVMIQGDGWQEFAKAYSLKKSDMLIFKYNRHKCFEVLLFDHANLCEKEVSYFVRIGQPRNSHGSDDSSGEEIAYSAEEFTDKNQDPDDDSVYKFGSRRNRNSGRTRKDCSSNRAAHSKDGYDGDEGDETSNEENVSAEDCNAPKKTTTEGVRGVPSNVSRKRNSKVSDKTISLKRKKQRIVTYKSNRRPVTEAEKEKALEKAREVSSQNLNSFFVVMRPSSVYKRFYMHISSSSRSFQLRSSNVEVPEISSEDGDDDFDNARRNRHRRKKSGVTCKSHYPGSDAHNRDPHEDELDKSSDEEKSSTEEDRHTPKKAATARVREVPSNISRKRKNTIAGNTTFEENGKHCKSSVSQVTEGDKKQALEMAKEAAAKFTHPLVEVMRPSSVHRRYFLSIPKDWKFRSKLQKDQEVILRVKENTWTCTFCLTSNNVGLLCGWKRFVPDNKLEEFDVCVFVPAEEQNGKLFLDVIVFRARP